MKKGHTISEIARLSGTSKATVSRVLNNPKIVSEGVRKRILAIMEEIGYTPNPFAQRLSGVSTWGIALFVFDIINPFFALMVRQIGRLTMERRLALTVCDTENDEEKEKLYLDYLLENRIGGIIFTEGISLSIVDEAKKRVPIVLVDQHYNPDSVPEVTSDNFTGARQATEYLIQLNHRRIAFVAGPSGWPSAKERLRGYRAALETNGIEYDPGLVFEGDFRLEAGLRAFEYFLGLPQWPTAVFCANDQMALGALYKAQAMNLAVPNDVSIVGFDAIPHLGFGNVRLTTVCQDIPRLCSSAVGLLMRQLRGEETQERIVVPTRLVVGETCKKLTLVPPDGGTAQTQQNGGLR